MALSRTQSVITYKSSTGAVGQDYYFDVVLDNNSYVSVRNIHTPTGLIQDSMTGLPLSVITDINEATDLVTTQFGQISVATGNIVFTGQTSHAVVLAGGLLNNTDYQVYYTLPVPIAFRTTGKTTTGFTAEASAPYGSVGTPLTVGYSVLVVAAPSSAMGGAVTFTAADNSEIVVAFARSLTSADYRVVLSPNNFYPAQVINRTKQGFTIQLGITLTVPQTATVGYDVLV